MADEYKETIIFNVKSSTPTDSPPERKKHGGSTKQKRVRKERKVSPEKFQQMLKSYDEVVVNDYGDEYHMSEEDRKKKFKYYEVFSRLAKCKRKFRKLDEFVKVYRISMECLKAVADSNGIYKPEDFTMKVLKGKIKVFGLNFPKYIGKDRKDINWKYVINYIMDPSLDVNELTTINESESSDPNDEELMRTIFSDEKLEEIREFIREDRENTEMESYDENDDDQGFALYANPKFTKRFIKDNPGVMKNILAAMKEERRRRRFDNTLRSFVFDMTEEDYEYIAKIDRDRGYVSDSDVPTFKGDIMNDDDYNRYMYELDRYEKDHIKENYRGKMRTIGEIEEIELKNALEEAGWNLRALYREKDKEKKLRKAYKADKKREEELKKKLTAIQSRQEKRKKTNVKFNSKKKKKKDKKEND